MLSEMVVGMTLDQAYNIKAKDILKNLDGLPDNKVHCSVLGDKALRAAIDDYYRKNGMEDRITTQGARVVCQCMQVTDEDIEHAVLDGARSFGELQEMTKIGTGCGECLDEAQRVLSEYVQKHFGL